MDVLVATPEEPQNVSDLLDWLWQEDELRRRVRRSETSPRPGEMGALAETLTVAVGGGGALTVLLASVSSWIRTRRSDVTVEITVGKKKISIDAKRINADAESLQKLIIEAGQALDRD
jgi:hypothetical protein